MDLQKRLTAVKAEAAALEKAINAKKQAETANEKVARLSRIRHQKRTTGIQGPGGKFPQRGNI